MKLKRLLIELSKELLMQFSICIGALLFFTFYFGITLSDLGPAFIFGAFLLPVTLGMVNVFSFHLIPEYLFKQRYSWFALYTAYTLVISIFLIAMSSFYGVIFINSWESVDTGFMLSKNLYLIIIGVYIVVLFTSLFSSLRESHKIHHQNQQLQFALLNGELQLKQDELSYLKMQIHPHFLFNTLNTIYGSAIAKSNQTPELIIKLSNLLDYILYQTKKSLVPLQDEVHHLKYYLDLEKLRHGKKLTIKSTFPDQLSEQLIAPMLFLPLLENSFKHGRSQVNDAFVELRIEASEGNIFFFLKNSFEETDQDETLASSGIGIQNIKKRLELLYPKAHNFTFEKVGGYFIVNLDIQTNQPKSS